jgi:hypothetical protein
MTDTTTTTTAAAPASSAQVVDSTQPAAGATAAAAAARALTSEVAAPAASKAGALGESGDQVAADKAKAVQPAVTEIEITVPEGAKVDEAMIAEFKALAKDQGLTSASASRLVAWDIERQAKAMKAAEATWAKQGEDWEAANKADPEIGGQKYATTVNNAQRALKWAGIPGLQKALVEMGLQNHPGLLRLCAKFGAALAEDKSPFPGGPGAKVESQGERLRREYPSMYNEDGTPKIGAV